jgi:hypothetical protein
MWYAQGMAYIYDIQIMDVTGAEKVEVDVLTPDDSPGFATVDITLDQGTIKFYGTHSRGQDAAVESLRNLRELFLNATEQLDTAILKQSQPILS